MNLKEAYKFVTEKQIPGCQSYIDKHRVLKMSDKVEYKVGQIWEYQIDTYMFTKFKIISKNSSEFFDIEILNGPHIGTTSSYWKLGSDEMSIHPHKLIQDGSINTANPLEEWKRIEAEGPKIGQLWCYIDVHDFEVIKITDQFNCDVIAVSTGKDKELNTIYSPSLLKVSNDWSLFDLGDSLNIGTQPSKVGAEVKLNIVNPIHNPDVPEDLEELHRRHLAFMRGSL